MKIICDTTFLDGTDRFEAGDQRTVSDERGAYFCSHGWAHEAGAEPSTAQAGDVTLDIRNTGSSQEASHG